MRPLVQDVVLVTPEVEPFYRKGGLGNVCGELAGALNRAGVTTNVVTGWYDSLANNPPSCVDIGVACEVAAGGRRHVMRILRGNNDGVGFFFLALPDLMREAYMGDPLGFAMGLGAGTFRAVEALTQLGLLRAPQVLHAHDWPSALVPLLLRAKHAANPLFNQTASVVTIHNAKHIAGWIPRQRFDELEIGQEHWHAVAQPGQQDSFSLLRGAINRADKLNAVSRTNRDEMLNPPGGFGLELDYQARGSDFVGIGNGISYQEWLPVTAEQKARSKAALQRRFGFARRKRVPLLGMVARIDRQKGVKAVVAVIGRLLASTQGGIQFVYLGEGHPADDYAREAADGLRGLARAWPGNARFVESYTTQEQKAVFQAIDLFLYPSEYEPFGTRPVVALRHRVPGVVTHTGGLADNFAEYDPTTGQGNGWLLQSLEEGELERAVLRALKTFDHREHWEQVTANAAAADHSWDRPAREYIELYADAVAAARSR